MVRPGWNGIAMSLQTVAEQLSLAAVPFGWVVERDAIDDRPARKLTRRERARPPSDWRTILVVLTDDERRRNFGQRQSVADGNERRSPRAHPRRGHWRRVETKPKPIWVRPSWIGPEDTEIDGCHYRVRLDL